MTEAEVELIVGKLDAVGFSADAVDALRASDPELRLAHVQADDLDDHEPFMDRPEYLVFLLASDGHCLSIAKHLDSSVGLVLAEK